MHVLWHTLYVRTSGNHSSGFISSHVYRTVIVLGTFEKSVNTQESIAVILVSVKIELIIVGNTGGASQWRQPSYSDKQPLPISPTAIY